MNIKSLIYKSIFALVAFACVAIFLGSITHDPHRKQVDGTGISLKCIRETIKTFQLVNNRYPDTLLALNNFISSSDEKRFYRRENKEYISNPAGCGDEHITLDDTGGWYYNKTTGEVKVNVTRPLKVVFKRYFYLPARNEIPSEW